MSFPTSPIPAWTLIDTHPIQGRTFQRPLGINELIFLWDGFFNGTADSLHHIQLHLKHDSSDAHLFSESNVAKAWLSTKRRYPLAGATVRDINNRPLKPTANSKAGGGDGSGTGLVSEPHFVITEGDLAALRPQEIIFGQVAGVEEAQQQVAAILNGPRPLSQDLLVQLHIFRETGAEKANILHIMVLTAHCVADEIATFTFARCLLDTLARGDRAEPTRIPLEDRLAMAISSADVEPIHLRSLSPAARRWRRAAGMVILQLRMAKRQGGHTLPCRLTRSTPYNPAKPGQVSISLTHTQTAAVISNCRLLNLTFGNAYLVLAQVAMTRVLYRRYLHGKISEEEWEYRKQQPHMGGCPLNLRPFLDDTWLEKGGGGEFVLSINFFFYQLPFMTLGETARQRQLALSDGAPPFSDLLTFDRFLHRAESVKKQTTALFSHPLFFEIAHAIALVMCAERMRHAVFWQMKHAENSHSDNNNPDDDEVLMVTAIPAVWAFSGSSIGNVDLMLPIEYPIPPTHPLSPYSSNLHPLKAGYVTSPSCSPSQSEAEVAPKIMVENCGVHLHTRPGELYLNAGGWCGQLRMYAFYDGNVFEEQVVREWLDEVREAVLWYLGQTHSSRQTQQCGGRQTEHMQAKL